MFSLTTLGKLEFNSTLANWVLYGVPKSNEVYLFFYS